MKETIFAAVLAMSCWSAWATQTVQVVWPFASGSAQAAVTRNLVESANQQQDKYQFVFVNRPGAGGVIAANYVASAPTLTLLSNTSSFYTRPLLYHESYNPEDFRVVSTICLNTPVAIIARKYTSFDQLKKQNATVGVIPGSITQVLTQLIMQHNPEVKFTEIPYKGTIEATTDMLGGHVDASVDFMSVGNLARLPSDAKVIGISGTRSIGAAPSFQSLKIKGLDDLVMSFYIFAPKTLDPLIAQDLNRIFNNAINSNTVQTSCNNENGITVSTPYSELDQLHRHNQDQWRKLTQGIPKQ
jgi:tripartite-type tricarboxylate transporter receptor subunit TctC